MKSYRRQITFRFILLCLVVWALSTPRAWSQSEHTAKLVDGAKKEGKLVWYTSMNVADSRRLLDVFEQKYPFVKTNLFRVSGEKLMNRILTETRAGRWEYDVVSSSTIDILVSQNLIAPYVSPESQFFMQEFKHPKGYWTAIQSNYFVIGYNTRLVSEQEAPRRWEDLLNLRWKGKISIDQEDYKWYATLVKAWGQEKARRYMKALARQDIQWRKGHTLITQLMAAGEFPAAIVYAHRTEEMKNKGAPIEWVNTVDPVVVSVAGIGLSAKPSHPNTAKLFIDYILSKEAQEMIRSFNRIPARSDVEPLTPEMDPKRLKFRVLPKDMATRYEEYVEEFRRIFGL